MAESPGVAPDLAVTSNPYYPIGSSIAGWTPNESSVFTLLGAFSGASVVLFSSTFILAKRIQPTLTRGELLTTMWFVLSGTVHILFEGYFISNFSELASQQTIIAQMWKEYAFSDSRYLTSNGLVFCLETITVFVWGPMCLLVAAFIVMRSPWRHPLQIIVSLAHLYGDTLYYATSFFDEAVHGISYSRPEAFYFWFYFIFMNSLWIIIPAALILQSSWTAATAIAAATKRVESKKSQ
ncbi:hypothetical protein CERZMDRAFT_96749 [Cercospora zeae-maydis SCOH1-5]|uniref:EXPERA domain-containing protein n=1 Tax=Cercospora zeae-maydis SCOH1-5 TaxID=717836 RepID=A0A6A6FIM0_9PEZI|nr:hypothetical protein CERZMDRAFT_96749 [Cercospora zeae-maydis SCOH1-5]